MREPKEQAVAPDDALNRVLQHDRLIGLAGIVGISALAWMYAIYLTQDMGMTMMLTPESIWDSTTLSVLIGMWTVMMIAMMTPSAASMLLTFARVEREQDRLNPLLPTMLFLFGYLLIWMGFSGGAALAQWGLHNLALDVAAPSNANALGALILVSAGIYQWTPLKRACLTRCRTPLNFLLTNWRQGLRGALGMGVQHGAFCLGCCWLLMMLLFVVGAMNLFWMALLSVFVVAEKIFPRGEHLGRIAGLLFVGIGGWLAFGMFA